MRFDHYKFARDLAHDLTQAGYSNYATKLSDAIEAGFTSGEILMALRSAGLILVDNAAIPLEFSNRAEKLVQEIEKSFNY